MKKIGIVGGVAWPSTVQYYAGLCRLSEHYHRSCGHSGPPVMPEISIESLDIAKAVSGLGSDNDETSWVGFEDYHRAALQRLERSGAELAIIASNTSHHRLPAITHGVSIPVLDLYRIVATACARIGAGEVLVLGTACTMQSKRLREVFDEAGIVAAGPEIESERTGIVELIEKLQLDQGAPAFERIGNIARTASARQFTGLPVVCLACTELPLAFSAKKDHAFFETDGVRYVNSAALHIRAAFDHAAVDA